MNTNTEGNTTMKKYNEKALDFAIGHFLSDWDKNIPNDKLLEMMYSGEYTVNEDGLSSTETEDANEYILPWEPFEYMPLNWIAERIEMMAWSLTGEDFR
jgi:hypothetical protein